LPALRAAAETRDAVAELEVEVRIGVNTGEVVTSAADTLVTGDAINVAARLQQAASPGDVLIGEATYALVRGAVGVEELDPLELEGKAEPVVAFRLLAVGEAVDSAATQTCQWGRHVRASAAKCTERTNSAGPRRRVPRSLIEAGQPR
jgi:class 3 adenylate cyclase